jgi:hypothetical protein
MMLHDGCLEPLYSFKASLANYLLVGDLLTGRQLLTYRNIQYIVQVHGAGYGVVLLRGQGR